MVLRNNLLQLIIGKIGWPRIEIRKFLTQIKIINLSVEWLATIVPPPKKQVPTIKKLDKRETAT